MTVYVAILLGYASSFLFRKRIPTSSYPFFAFSFCLAFAYYGLSILVMGTFTLSAQANADPLDDSIAWAMHHIVGFLFGGAVSFLTLSRRAIFNKHSVLFDVLTLPVSNFVYLLIKGPKDSAPRFTLNTVNGATFVALIVALPFIKPIAEDAVTSEAIPSSFASHKSLRYSPWEGCFRENILLRAHLRWMNMLHYTPQPVQIMSLMKLGRY